MTVGLTTRSRTVFTIVVLSDAVLIVVATNGAIIVFFIASLFGDLVIPALTMVFQMRVALVFQMGVVMAAL